MLRRNFRPESDVDVLYAFEEGHGADHQTLLAIEAELSGMFGGRRIDFVPADRLKRRIKAKVIGEAEVQYAAR